MIEGQQLDGEHKRLDEPRKKSSVLSTVAWIVIAVMVILIAAMSVWAGRQPNLPSIWAPE
jgi:hypothetical protein